MNYKILEDPGNHGTTDSILAHLIGAIAIGVASSMDLADKSIVNAAHVAIRLAEDRQHYDEVIDGCTVKDTIALTQHDETDEAFLYSSPMRCMDEVTLSTNKNGTSKIHDEQSCWSSTLADTDVDVDVDVDATLAVDNIVEAVSASATASASVSEDKEDKEEDEEEALRTEFEIAVREQLANEASAGMKPIDLQTILDIGDDDIKMDMKKQNEMKKGNAYPDLHLLNIVTVRSQLS